MVEIWKNIDGYEGLYQVSNCGRVRSFDRWVIGKSNSKRLMKGRIMKLIKDSKGYLHVQLCKNGKINCYLVHRLVAQAFLDNPNNLPIINHRDECKTNNVVENLEWCTASYNMNYNDGQKRRGVKKINGKLAKKVNQYSLEGQFIKEWESAHEVQRQLGYSRGNISTCCLDKRKTAYGYIWRYAD